MTIAIGFWSVFGTYLYIFITHCSLRSSELTPGKEEVIVPVEDLKISNVALGDTLVDPNGRSTVKITYTAPIFSNDEDEDEDEDGGKVSLKEVTTVLCSLSAGKVWGYHWTCTLYNYKIVV